MLLYRAVGLVDESAHMTRPAGDNGGGGGKTTYYAFLFYLFACLFDFILTTGFVVSSHRSFHIVP
jgi:hypothetical protein